LEAFNHVTDHYYDDIHDGFVKVGPWIKDQRTRSWRKASKKERQNLPAVEMTGTNLDVAADSRHDVKDDRGRRHGHDDRRRSVCATKRFIVYDSNTK
jgi:hypothetical protein